MKKSTGRTVLIFFLLSVVVFFGAFLVISLTSDSNSNINGYEAALKSLDKLYKKINADILDSVKGNVDMSAVNVGETLPDISKYPAQVENTTATYIEIFSSTEKATVTNNPVSDSNRWLVDVAEAFNQAGFTINGEPVSVRVRGMASGLAADYISSGKYIPDAFTPSNELWGDALKAMGVDITLVNNRLVGNVGGIVLSNDKYNEVLDNYGSITMKTIIEAVSNGDISIGYTNPFSSSTGLNFLLSILYSLDEQNPLSDVAVASFGEFQKNIPFIAYTMLQMKEAAISGTLDGFVFEYQQFLNSSDLASDYAFTPLGARHDSPIYALGDLSDTKKEILDLFINFCLMPQSQMIALDYGFNEYESYVNKIWDMDGSLTSEAQKLWKNKKSGLRETIAVFVADISGSMDGQSLLRLKESLLTGSKSISQDSSIGLVTFSDAVNIALPIDKFDLDQRSFFAGAVNGMKASGNTAMFDAIIVAEKMLIDKKAENPDAKFMLFVLTDGESNRGNTFDTTKSIIEGLGIPIYTIGYNADIEVLETISAISGAANINADIDDVVYQIQSLFNAQM